MKSKMRKIIAVLTVIMLISGMMILPSAAAVSYKGKGSKSNPYIVETAEQLDGIRNNLKAHYKLGNTIDLSGISNFKPIGNLSEAFEGSLVCDLGTDGKPKYAIKNLKIEVAPSGCTKAEKFSGYKEKKSGWEAGLFGYASGATFKNILVLDATVNSKVEGCYQMNGDYTINPGTDEQGAGILLALCKKVTVSGCGVSGTVTSASNHVGGMIGLADNSKISKSYSYAAVTSTGAWSSGGFIGTLNKTAVTTSFYNGTFSGGQTHAGAFAGDGYDEVSKITDCWASGTVITPDSGCFLGTKNHSDGTDFENTDIALNCYTLAKIEGRKNAQTNKKVKNNNYITDEVGGFEIGFAAASQGEINAAFALLPNWTVADGTYPQIKGLVPVSDSALYTVNAVTDSAPEQAVGNDTLQPINAEEIQEKEGQDTEETEDGADVEVKTVFDNTLTNLRGAELVLVIVLSSLVFATLIAATVVFILTVKRMGKQKNELYKNYGDTENEE